MEITLKIRYDKLKYNEYITYKGKERKFNFGYPILDFINANIKELLSNTEDITKKLEALSQDDSYFIFNIFYASEILKELQNPNLDTTEKNAKIKIILDTLEYKQQLFSTVIDFCFLYNANITSYVRDIDRFIFICNKLHYNIIQPKYTFTTDDITSKDTIEFKEVDFAKLDKEYMQYKQNNRKSNHFDSISYNCDNVDELFSIFILTVFDRHYIISKCQNCNKLFVPFKKNDALYCDRISPQKENKTCKEYASKKPKGVQELYRRIYMKKFARYNRNKDNFTIKNDYETWKSQADKLKTKLNKGIITADEFEQWLLENDK